MNRVGKFTGRASRAFPLCLFALFQGCTLFSGKPPLPKHASIEHVAKPASNFPALIADVDVVYFPENRAAFGARSEPAALLLEALEQSGKPLAVGWDLIDATQQPLLDQIQGAPIAAREQLINRLEIIGSGRAREHCRAVLRIAPASTRQLALRCPASLIVKLASLEAPTPEEEKLLPHGYRAPPGGFDSYAEHLGPERGGSQRDLTESYRAQIFNQEFIAERIVRHFREVGGGNKLLAFLGAADLEEGRGVPTYVAQKLPLHQLVLGSDLPNESRAKLLTRQIGRAGAGFEIVDRAPTAAGD